MVDVKYLTKTWQIEPGIYAVNPWWLEGEPHAAIQRTSVKVLRHLFAGGPRLGDEATRAAGRLAMELYTAALVDRPGIGHLHIAFTRQKLHIQYVRAADATVAARVLLALWRDGDPLPADQLTAKLRAGRSGSGTS